MTKSVQDDVNVSDQANSTSESVEYREGKSSIGLEWLAISILTIFFSGLVIFILGIVLFNMIGYDGMFGAILIGAFAAPAFLPVLLIIVVIVGLCVISAFWSSKKGK
ncbi:hypothetical protein [Piscirickettsia litoralis]|uniref:Uncharacterized protein n=1 Tax=Piscirickettsia litoralis TaxID=1891921 RepID=A0ABX3A6X4_9GAMM|nr:hypothetical protein [Piscirickettsia litoralis]ODN43195.1 hypothetical protein BGC07_10040 [Piscirickettsia litoralis]